MIITDSVCIPFKSTHPSYGRAEFELCPIYKRGKLVQLFINSSQQEENISIEWNGSCDGIMISGYHGLNDPKVWRTWWCKHHKTQCMTMYVPDGANYLWINALSTLTIGFTKTKML